MAISGKTIEILGNAQWKTIGFWGKTIGFWGKTIGFWGKTIGFWGKTIGFWTHQKKGATPSDTGRRGLGRCRRLLRKAAAGAWESGRSPGTEGSHGWLWQGMGSTTLGPLPKTRTSQTAPAIRSLQFHVQNPLAQWKNMVVLLLDYLISPVTSCTIPRFWLVLESISVAAVAFVGLSHLLSGWNKLPSIKSTWLPWLEDSFPLKMANSQGQTANLGDGRTIDQNIWNYPKNCPHTNQELPWTSIGISSDFPSNTWQKPIQTCLMRSRSSAWGQHPDRCSWSKIVNIGKL